MTKQLLPTTINSGLQQPVPIDDARYTRMMSHVTQVLKRMDRANNPEIGFEEARDLLSVSRISGMALARLLSEMQQRWETRWKELGIANQRYEDQVYQELGIPPVTTRRYVRAWQTFVAAPTDIQPVLKDRPMEDQVAIAAAARHMPEKTFEPKQWEEIVKAPTTTQLRKTLNTLLERPEKTRLVIRHRKDGTVEAMEKRRLVRIGYLLPEEELEKLSPPDRDLARRALERLRSGGNVLEE